jgi:Kef-type K+ transport system membrane component KefB
VNGGDEETVAEEIAFLLDLGVLAISALVLSVLFAKIRLPIVSAQILAGMLVGPTSRVGLRTLRPLDRFLLLRLFCCYLFWVIPRGGEFSFVIGQFTLALGVIGADLFSLIGVAVMVTAIVGSILQRMTEPNMAKAIYPLKPERDHM